MKIYLCQHGKALDKSVDPERGLSSQGIKEVELIARVASEHGVEPTVIWHSGKKRAAQTANLFIKHLSPLSEMVQVNGMNPDDMVEEFANKDLPDGVLLVGHLPFLDHLLSFLILNRTGPSLFTFQNAGIVCLEMNACWKIKWTLMPQID